MSGRQQHSLSALILAAGYSSRMGEFKPLLTVGSAPAIERAIDVFLTDGIDDVAVVTGYRAESLRPILKRKGIREVFNPDFRQGMYSSVVAGVRSLAPETSACFVLPADMPLIRPRTVKSLANAFRKRPAAVLYPVFQHRRGHPPLIRRDVLEQVPGAEPADGLRGLLTLQTGVREIAVLDEGIHLDMDTSAELERLRAQAACGAAPSLAECEAILEDRNVEQRIVRHSRAVCRVALKLAQSVAQRGVQLDLAVVRAGALLHDVAKGIPDHALAGAGIVRRLGFPCLFHVIASHGDFDFSGESLSEAALVYLADKVVRGGQVVSIEQRFHPALSRCSGDPEATAAVVRRLDTAQKIRRCIEATCGRELRDILADAG